MIRIDGSAGEGGGQILRTALGLSLVTGQPFQIEGIRAGRAKPGLLRQHLTAVKAAAEMGSAEVEGAELGSRTLAFRPRAVKAGEYRFAIGSAGSTTLVLQTVLPALMTAAAPSTVTLEGGTHNMQAPPFEFLDRCFAPALRAMGFGLSLTLDRYGFYPAGGGRITAKIAPCDRPSAPFSLLTRGEITARRATAVVVNLRRDIGKRELGRVIAGLAWPREVLHLDDAGQADCAGNVLFLQTEAAAPVTEIVTAFGQLGVSAEAVGDTAVAAMREYLTSDAPVGEHLADQLLIPLVLAAGGGEFRAVKASLHTTTNLDTIERFLPGRFAVTHEAAGAVHIAWPAARNGNSLS